MDVFPKMLTPFASLRSIKGRLGDPSLPVCRPLFLAAFILWAVLSPVHAAPTVRDALNQPDAWFRSDDGRRFITNVLSHQSPVGSWPKNGNTGATLYTGDPAKLNGTFDNGATTGELRLLARAIAVTGNTAASNAVLRGLDHILSAQYTNGGWPQWAPPPRSYHRHITFNDDSMRRLMELLRDVAGPQGRSLPASRLSAGDGPAGISREVRGGRSTDGGAAGTSKSDGGAAAARREPSPYLSHATGGLFPFIDSGRREAARRAFDKGIECILRSQIRVEGRLTAWCAQHDEVTLEPRPARSYELASLSGNESAGLLHLLMSLENASPEVVRAVHAGAAWFESVKLTGIREVRVDGDKKIVRDAAAQPLWARFYEIGTNRPFYCGRDGVKRYDLAEIESERRNGYAWHGTWGAELARRYATWAGLYPRPEVEARR